MSSIDSGDGVAAPSLLLRRAADRASAALQHLLRGAGVSLEKWWVLDVLATRDGMTMTELAGAVSVTGPTLTRIVDGLASEALVHRDVDPLDRRRVLVHVAPRGRSLRDSLSPAVREIEQATMASLLDPRSSEIAAVFGAVGADGSTARSGS